MLSNILIIYRKRLKQFNSIENVFDSVLPYIDANKFELRYASKGILNRVRNFIDLLKKDYSVLHITGHDHYLLIYPFKKSILTIHDIEALKRKSGLKKWVFKKLWFDLPIKNASIITTISEFSKIEILENCKFSGRIEVINNPLTLPVSVSVKNFNSVKPRILSIGVKENKNLNRLILALSKLNCLLVIIGNPSKGVLKKLEEYKLEYEIRSNISNLEMVEEYKKCDIVSFISTYEGFGLPIIEAQAAARVVLTSNVASMPEVAGDGAHFVDPFCIEDIRAGLEQIIKNQCYRNQLIENGLNNCKRFTPKFISSQYKNLYNQFLED